MADAKMPSKGHDGQYDPILKSFGVNIAGLLLIWPSRAQIEVRGEQALAAPARRHHVRCVGTL